MSNLKDTVTVAAMKRLYDLMLELLQYQIFGHWYAAAHDYSNASAHLILQRSVGNSWNVQFSFDTEIAEEARI